MNAVTVVAISSLRLYPLLHCKIFFLRRYYHFDNIKDINSIANSAINYNRMR